MPYGTFRAAKFLSRRGDVEGSPVLGVGIGWLREEFEAARMTFGDRGRHREMLTLCGTCSPAPGRADTRHHHFREGALHRYRRNVPTSSEALVACECGKFDG